MNQKGLQLDLSALAPEIHVQLRDQGVRIPGHMAASFRRTRAALIQLSVTGVVTREQRTRLDKRFIALIMECLRRYGKIRGGYVVREAA